MSLNEISTKLSFVVLTTLLVGGFPNFMVQEAHAAVNLVSVITNTSTQITVTFDGNIGTNGAANLPGAWTVAGNAPQSVTDESGGGTTSVVLTMSNANAFATDALPNVVYTDPGDATTIDSDDDATPIVVNQAATDGAPATFVSATASSTTIAITFSEDIVDTASDLADYVIGGVAGGSDISAKVVAGAVLTITTNGYSILSIDNPTITVTLTANELEDTGTLNDTVTFGPSAVTNGVASPTTNTSNGSGCDDCEAPTLGINSKSKRIVENGFTYNGKPTDAERFFTPYPLITVTVGKQNTAVFKIYEDKGPENIKHFSFAFGLAKGEIISESKAMIELDIDHEGTETVTITDSENALDNIKVSTNVENCNCNDSDTRCLVVTIDHRFRAPLDFSIVGTDVWDMERNSWQNYFNHGIEVVGPSINPPKEYDGINKGHIYHLTETGKTSAVDEFNNSWSLKYDTWVMDYIPIQQDTDEVYSMHGIARDDYKFDVYKYRQHLAAEKKLMQSCVKCNDKPFGEINNIYKFNFLESVDRINNPEMQLKMQLQAEEAQKIMDHILDPILHLK